MLLKQNNKILGCKTGKRRTAEMKIAGKKIIRLGISISKIAAATAGNTNFLCQFTGMINQHDLAASFTGFHRTHHSCSTRTNNDNILENSFQNCCVRFRRWRFLTEAGILAGYHIQTIRYHHDNKQKKRQPNPYAQGFEHTVRLAFIFVHIIQSRSQAI